MQLRRPLTILAMLALAVLVGVAIAVISSPQSLLSPSDVRPTNTPSVVPSSSPIPRASG